ncbi:MAG: phosphoribosyl-AMP cyclohydrolase [Chloroflexi bacterium]|nr:phosphoribosyl-AMP cyclohydrolase [Chloroflexota bacterium]MBL7161017.1 phosphoribosyl-AMP cyclohydrolase [Anaerolineales bacterium]
MKALKFNSKGLLTAVIQDINTQQVLMVAMMNAEAFEKTLETRLAHFWSRSRQTLWLKGETSGNILGVKEMRIDCDADAVLLLVEPRGPACHTGETSCFFTPWKLA